MKYKVVHPTSGEEEIDIFDGVFFMQQFGSDVIVPVVHHGDGIASMLDSRVLIYDEEDTLIYSPRMNPMLTEPMQEWLDKHPNWGVSN